MGIRTFDGLGHGPKVGCSIDIPLRAAGGLGRRGMVPVLLVMFRVVLNALMPKMGVRMLFPSKQRIEPVPDLAEEGIHRDSESVDS